MIIEYLVSCVSRARLTISDHRRKLQLLQSIGIIRRISPNEVVGIEDNEMEDSLRGMARYVKGELCVLVSRPTGTVGESVESEEVMTVK